MKTKIILASLLITTTLSAFGQSIPTNNSTHLDSLAYSLFDQEEFDKSREIWQHKLQQLDKQGAAKDSSYIIRLCQIGKCWYRTNQIDSAIATAQRVVDLYAQNVNSTDKHYAFYLDNLALYQDDAKKFDIAYDNCRKALDVYQNLHKNDYDLSIILIHCAETSHYMKKYNDAVAYELRALNILKQLYGEHSKEYIDEAPYLQKYYEENGDKDKAGQMQARIDKLQKEADDGEVDLPEMIEFETAEQAHAHNHDALRYCEYYLNHKLNDKHMQEAGLYILSWSQASGDVHIVMSENEAKITNSKEEGIVYILALCAGCSEYALKTGKADYSYDMFEYGMCSLLNFYQNNREITGENKYLEKFIAEYKKSQDDFKKMLRKTFDKQNLEDNKKVE